MPGQNGMDVAKEIFIIKFCFLLRNYNISIPLVIHFTVTGSLQNVFSTYYYTSQKGK